MSIVRLIGYGALALLLPACKSLSDESSYVNFKQTCSKARLNRPVCSSGNHLSVVCLLKNARNAKSPLRAPSLFV